MMGKSAWACVCIGVLGLVGCGSDDPTSQGKGTEKFTTWGEDYIQDEIPAGDGTDGFVDGWTLKYAKFLVNYHDITVADAAGNVAAKQDKPFFVDNTKGNIKDLVTFPDLDAKAYTNVSYEIKTAVADEAIIGDADPADLAMMVSEGLSVYVEGTASKGKVTKTFHWGFKAQTSYQDCHSAEENGISTIGVVVTNNQTDTSQLTTHGDHLYYDSLQSGDNAKPTLIRFDEKAAADDNGDGDGDVTIKELCQENIDPEIYNPSGLPGATIGDFVISLARTIGHFRGEGECTIKRIDQVSEKVDGRARVPCDEY